MAMATWAGRLGYDDDAEWLKTEAARVRRRICELLFCPEDQLFHDRLADGSFSSATTMTRFYPLLAGVATEETRRRLKELLLDPRHFRGECVIPTVSRSDPVYADCLNHEGNYWRGNIWPPANYIIYLAVKEAGWDDVAAELAARSARQFMEHWDSHGHAYENYPAEGNMSRDFPFPHMFGGREIRYAWGALMVLPGLEEIFGLEVTGPGLRFGNPYLPEQSSWNNFQFAGQNVRAETGPQRTHVEMGETWTLDAEPGVGIRHFVFENGTTEFVANTPMAIRLTSISAATSPKAQVLLNGKRMEAIRDGDSLSIDIHPGSTRVQILEIAG